VVGCEEHERADDEEHDAERPNRQEQVALPAVQSLYDEESQR
jgi:hypothetical protein